MATPTTIEEVPRTPLSEAKRLRDEGKALFVDVRLEREYQEAHIPGALHIPVSGPPEAYLRLPRERTIILY